MESVFSVPVSGFLGPHLFLFLWCVGAFFYFIFRLRLKVPPALSLVIVKHFHHFARRMHVIQTDSSVGVCFNSSALVIFLWLLVDCLLVLPTLGAHTRFALISYISYEQESKVLPSNAEVLCTLANWLHCIETKSHSLSSINEKYRLGNSFHHLFLTK